MGDRVLAEPRGAVLTRRCEFVELLFVDEARLAWGVGLEAGWPRPRLVVKGGLVAGGLEEVEDVKGLVNVEGLGTLGAALDLDPPAPIFQTLRTRFLADEKNPNRGFAKGTYTGGWSIFMFLNDCVEYAG